MENKPVILAAVGSASLCTFSQLVKLHTDTHTRTLDKMRLACLGYHYSGAEFSL